MSKKYIPAPLNTAEVVLPAELTELVEKLAENAHEVWAVNRINAGWTYGPARDDENKKTPCLVPYANLPESEKFYDRQLVTETLKSILKLNYKILIDGG